MPLDLAFIEIAHKLQVISNPMLIAGGAILAMISLRNGDLASRARANVDEALHKLPKLDDVDVREARRQSLREQNRLLLRRYKLLSTAFIITATGIATLVLGTFVAAGEQAPALGGLMVCLAGAFMIIGLLSLLLEFWAGSKTLILNDSSIR